jgi:flagellin
MDSLENDMTTISAGSAFYKVQSALDTNSNRVAKSMERLATGRTGVTAGDRPSSTVIANNMKSALASLKMGMQNATEVMQSIEVLNNDVKLLRNIMTRASELNTLGQNGLNTTADIANLVLEGGDLVLEFDAVQTQSKWSGKSLFGAADANKFTVNFGQDMTAERFGGNTITGTFTAATMSTGGGTDLITADLAAVDALALDIADQYMIASNKISQLSALTAGYALDISSKLDVDFAGETTELAKGQILAQAGTAMLAQANAQGQGMLALIQS